MTCTYFLSSVYLGLEDKHIELNINDLYLLSFVNLKKNKRSKHTNKTHNKTNVPFDRIGLLRWCWGIFTFCVTAIISRCHQNGPY